MRKVLILDTSILCVWLEVAGKITCGANQEWTKQRIDTLLEEEIQAGTTLVLPLASIIETGNHITQTNSRRYETAKALADLMVQAADEQSPWAAFSQQADLWDGKGLKQLATEWVSLVDQKLSIADATIKSVAEFYARANYHVEILTGDAGLKAYEPLPSKPTPKRRSQRQISSQADFNKTIHPL